MVGVSPIFGSHRSCKLQLSPELEAFLSFLKSKHHLPLVVAAHDTNTLGIHAVLLLAVEVALLKQTGDSSLGPVKGLIIMPSI